MKIVYHHRTRSTDAQRIHILEMVRAFEELGHEVRLVSLVPTESKMEDAARDAGDAWWQIVVRKIPFGYESVQLAYNLLGLFLIMWTLLRWRPELIYERYSLFNFCGVLAARLLRLPLVLEVNSPLALEQRRDGQIRAFRFAAWTERAICNMATRVIVVSTPLKQIMEDSGVDASKLVVMPNGVRLAAFQKESATEGIRETLGVSAKVVIGFVGWFRKWHGLETLVEAFHRGGLSERGAVLLMIGDGPATGDLKRAVEHYGIENDVIFTGAVPHDKVADLMQAVDIAVQPAANEYCCPMKILEYMVLRKAIVAPLQPNIQELLPEEDQAELFTPGDAMSLGAALARLVVDEQRRKKLGEHAYDAIFTRRLLWTNNASAVTQMVESRLGSMGTAG
jgi:glycosyltransferase involved in cell wall biosynthesis